jgi:hypothetical protein
MTPGVVAAADDGNILRPRDLLDRGFNVVAEGSLAEVLECREWEWSMRVLGSPRPEPMFRNLCLGAVKKYGAFQRLKSNDDEFVCISFRDWACFPSRTQN